MLELLRVRELGMQMALAVLVRREEQRLAGSKSDLELVVLVLVLVPGDHHLGSRSYQDFPRQGEQRRDQPGVLGHMVLPAERTSTVAVLRVLVQALLLVQVVCLDSEAHHLSCDSGTVSCPRNLVEVEVEVPLSARQKVASMERPFLMSVGDALLFWFKLANNDAQKEENASSEKVGVMSYICSLSRLPKGARF